ncbi:high-potential iron-sulfur protein [Pollutimonas harenae]|uniref:High-potential iron-sulfur protein n=1 Tax=Pollutimonas harenae TaxID=657015 RepID=A0A853GTC2_9BURK|nr:high-potential iron-sulfur protein [Pollutimonas harenae]NYT84026.1 high-potential iron-sulfur protein [Pollutimonas harenae]TEA73548.1 High potential iron-sulfur protein [Pollutimonas harenae]
MQSSRRTFLVSSIGLASSLALSRHVFADTAKVSESDPTAVAMGYKHDATQIDKAKQARYVAGEECSNCQLFQGKPGDAWGPCPIFSGKQVSAKGWCSAYTKKS